MKSYCIKSTNDKIIDYLLDRFDKIDFENIYYVVEILKYTIMLLYIMLVEMLKNFENFISGTYY